jgi:hypothetical protein
MLFITDTATGCFADGTIVIGEPANALTITSATPTNVSCNNDNSTITILAAGGTPYLRSSTSWSNSPLLMHLIWCTIPIWQPFIMGCMRCYGCVTMTNVTIISDPLPGLTVAVDNQCRIRSTFTITAITAASLTPLTHGIGGPTGTFQTKSNIYVPGTYTVSIKDKMVV